MRFYKSTKGLNMAFDFKNHCWASCMSLTVFQKGLIRVWFGRNRFLTGQISLVCVCLFVCFKLSPFHRSSLTLPFNSEQAN